MTSPRDAITGLYERHASAYDRDRGRSLQERAWLDRFMALMPGTRVADIGCGMGEPIARHLIDAGLRVTGIDSSPSLVAMCRQRFPAAEWIVGDMRRLSLGRRFDGLIAWDSFFHLSGDDQRAMFPRFAAHAERGAPLLFTTGTSEGEAIGTWEGEPLYHASLAVAEYDALLRANGFEVEAFRADDAECGGHTVWLACLSGFAHLAQV